jgi:dTDP-4-dehydrorhamnose 3,5-epimerase
MNITKTFIDGVFVIEPDIYKDKRGLLFESFREDKYGELCEKFVLDIVSCAHRNVLKGLHYSRHSTQLINLVHGVIYDVVVDLRKESKTFKQHFCIQLEASNPKQVYMPSRCAHGLYVLSDSAVLAYKCSRYYDTSDDLSVMWNDPELGIKWPLTSEPILSGKDLRGEYVSNVEFC